MTAAKTALEALDKLYMSEGGEDLCDEYNTIKQALTANTWRKPETVPKDGTWIILHLKKTRSGKQRTVREACYSPRLGRWNYYTCTDKDILGWQPLPEQPPC